LLHFNLRAKAASIAEVHDEEEVTVRLVAEGFTIAHNVWMRDLLHVLHLAFRHLAGVAVEGCPFLHLCDIHFAVVFSHDFHRTAERTATEHLSTLVATHLQLISRSGTHVTPTLPPQAWLSHCTPGPCRLLDRLMGSPVHCAGDRANRCLPVPPRAHRLREHRKPANGRAKK